MKKYVSMCFLSIFLLSNIVAIQANPSPTVDGDVIEVVPGTDPNTPDVGEDSNDNNSENNTDENGNANIDNNIDNNTNSNTNDNVNTNTNENTNNTVNDNTNDNMNNNLQSQNGIKWSFHEEFQEVDDPIQRKITQMNEGITAAQVLIEDNILYHNEVDLNNLTLLSKIKDLRVTNTAGQNVSKEYKNIEVTWEEPRLNDNIETIQILHYSTVRNCWEVFAPKSVDYDKKTITAFFYDLSPVGVLYKVKDAESMDEQLVVTSVKSVNVYIVIIVFGLVMALYAFYKAREQKEVE